MLPRVVPNDSPTYKRVLVNCWEDLEHPLRLFHVPYLEMMDLPTAVFGIRKRLKVSRGRTVGWMPARRKNRGLPCEIRSCRDDPLPQSARILVTTPDRPCSEQRAVLKKVLVFDLTTKITTAIDLYTEALDRKHKRSSPGWKKAIFVAPARPTLGKRLSPSARLEII